MLTAPAPFPYVGSHCFEKGSGRPVTVIQHRGDGRILVRRDDEQPPSAFNSGSARGTCTLRRGQLAKTQKAALASKRRRKVAA